MNRTSRHAGPVCAVHAVVASALLLAGCATTTDLPMPEVPAPTAALNVRTAVLAEAPALTEDAPVPAQWWTLFRDPALVALEADAAAANFDLRAAAARVEESRAQLGLASAERRPQVAADAGYTRAGLSRNSPLVLLGAPIQGTDTWSLGVSAGWELDLWGYLKQVDAAARARLEASGYGLAAARVSVAGDVARTYLLLRGVQAQQAIVEEHRAIAADLVRLTGSRLRNGVATRLDVAAAQAVLNGILARQEQLRHQRDTLMNALALLLGQPPRALDARLAGALVPALPAQLPIGVSSELARQRPDILQAEARLRAAVADIGAAKADFYPRIRLTGGLGVQAFQLADLGSWDSRQYSLGPSLHLPIFDGGRLRGNLALSQARHTLAAIDYQRTVLGAWHEVDDALGAYASELHRHQQLEGAMAENRTALEVAERGYREGSADFTTVLVARRSLLASQAELADSATASALSVVALYRALGGGWSDALAAAPARS